MDEMDRTCSAPFEIPEEAMSLLRRAADLGLEKACDFRDWDDDRRAVVLHAARTVDIFHLGTPEALQVAELADNALAWMELSDDDRPRTLDALRERLAALDEVRELIELRDRALRYTGLGPGGGRDR